VSIQDLRPNSQDTSAFYLTNIYQVLADPTQPQASIPSSLATPPPFSPPRYAIWVNSLWFLSFIISLFCALLATLLQQWARRYLENTQPARCSPEKRARLRSFFAGGVDKMKVSWAVGSLSVLVHLSLFLFFSGLIVFLHNVNHNVSLSVIWCLGIFLTVYGCFSIMPMFLSESPYNTPLTLPVVVIVCMAGYIAYCVFLTALVYGVLALTLLFYILHKCLRFLCSFFRNRLGHCLGVGNGDRAANPDFIVSLLHRFKQFSIRRLCSVTNGVFFSLYSRGMKSFFLEDAIEDPDIFPLSKIDLGILDWSVGALGEAEELEDVIEAIPDFLNAQKVKDLKKDLPNRSKFIKSLGRFLGRTLLSNSLSDQVKIQRVEICMNTANKICDSYDITRILRHLSHLHFDGVPQTIQMAELLAGWCTGTEDYVSEARREIVASILPHVQKRDNGWIALARDQFGVEEDVLRDNIALGDNSVLLAIVLHAIRNRTIETLSTLSRIDILDANAQLQNEFCALWNQLVLDSNNLSLGSIFVPSRMVSWSSVMQIIWKIRPLYVALHQGTDSAPTQFSASTSSYNAILLMPSSYPSCNIATHHTHHPISTSPTRHDDPKDTSLLESQPIPGGTTSSPSQKADEPIVIPGRPSLPELPHLAHGFPPSSQITYLSQIAPQATSATLASVHGFFDRAPLDQNPLHSAEASRISCQPSLPITDLSTGTVRTDKPTLDLPTKEMGETSQTPAATSITSGPHLGPLQVTVTPSKVPHPPSVSVQQLGDSLNTLSPISSVLTLSHPLARNAPQDIATRSAASDITGEAILLPAIVSESDSLRVPIMASAPRSGLNSSVPPSSVESAPVLSDHVSRPIGSTPSTLTVPHSQITPPVSSVLDVHVTTSVGSRDLHEHDETRDPNAAIPMELSLHADQSRPSTHDIARDPVRPGLHRHGQY
jgi:Family of unknown function (DUF6535)